MSNWFDIHIEDTQNRNTKEKKDNGQSGSQLGRYDGWSACTCVLLEKQGHMLFRKITEHNEVLW